MKRDEAIARRVSELLAASAPLTDEQCDVIARLFSMPQKTSRARRSAQAA